MLRKGTITSINEDGSGIITDDNEQEIHFRLEKNFFENLKGVPVSFDIELSPEGLVAVGIQLHGSCV
ncbi:hypothetical protein [Pedobacter sp. Leaf176]|uniref:hypothetical protein n=1 Tax=Pedobacter sp. Leaf176 TaxID=1736286 RepID=UPI0006F70504|nr:hypothetical protein [Pedobacter sp. Leaf176]KQR67286.1 hypothetical protein ASF92_16400 [Pedobacter sp. Leaf176]